jgi:hypothetical protein
MAPSDLGPGSYLAGRYWNHLLGGFLWLRKFLSKVNPSPLPLPLFPWCE